MTAFLGYTKEEFENYFPKENIESIEGDTITLKNGKQYRNLTDESQLQGAYGQYEGVIDKDNLRLRFYLLYFKRAF